MASVSFNLVTLTTLRARDLMTTDAITIADYEHVDTAVALLASLGCRFVPVMRDRRLVGVVDEPLVARTLRPRSREQNQPPPRAAVVHHRAPLATVIERLISSGGDHLVVADDNGEVVGVVTAIAIVRLLDAALARAGA